MQDIITMRAITINDKEYYSAKDLISNKSITYYSGCGASNSKFIKKYDLDEDIDFNYFIKKEDKYILTRKRTRGTVLMISKKWVDSFDEQVKRKISIEPEILDIGSFIDDEGNEYEIEVRGKRNHKNCYFLAKDVAKCFEIKNLENHIQKTRNSKYIENVHYSYFFSSNCKALSTDKSKNAFRLFLTYKGVLTVLFSSITPKANKFVDWACEIVFSAHMGTNEQKISLSADLMGLTRENVKQYFDTCTAPISGIYLIRLGTVKDLRKTFNIPEKYPDQWFVHKYGRSNNISTRFSQHVRTYNKLRIYDIKLIYYCPIDAEFAPKAEMELRNYFIENGMKLDNETHTEICIFESKSKMIKKALENLFNNHLTTNVALIDKLRDTTAKLDHEQVLRTTLEEAIENERKAFLRERAVLERLNKEKDEKYELTKRLHNLQDRSYEQAKNTPSPQIVYVNSEPPRPPSTPNNPVDKIAARPDILLTLSKSSDLVHQIFAKYPYLRGQYEYRMRN